jgi:hypothetical protein
LESAHATKLRARSCRSVADRRSNVTDVTRPDSAADGRGCFRMWFAVLDRAAQAAQAATASEISDCGR